MIPTTGAKSECSDIHIESPRAMAEDSPSTPPRQQGTSRAYILDRLRRENRTDLADAVERNEVSAFSVAVSLGWTKRPPTLAAVTHQARKRRHRFQAIDGSLSSSQMMELWLGPNPTGSLFNSREELEAAWTAHRDELMARHGSHGRRPMIWWELAAGDLRYPGYDRERSALWRAGHLEHDEKLEVERSWKLAFNEALDPDFTMNDGTGILTGDRARAAHFAHHDIPRELVRRWSASERRRRARAIRNSTAEAQERTLDVASSAEG